MARRSSPSVVNSRPTIVACRSHSASSFVHSTMTTGCDATRRAVRWRQPRPVGVAVHVVELDGNSDQPMTTGNSNVQPAAPSPPAVIDDNDDRNDVTMTSPADDNSTKKKTRRIRRRSSRKSEEIYEVTEQPADKGFYFYLIEHTPLARHIEIGTVSLMACK